MRHAFIISGVFCLLMSQQVEAGEEFEEPLWPGVAPGSAGSTLQEEFRDRPISDGTQTARDRSVAGVTTPTLTVYLPDQQKATRVAMVVCPGGGFSH